MLKSSGLASHAGHMQTSSCSSWTVIRAQALHLVHQSTHSHCVMSGSDGLGAAFRAGSMVQRHGVQLTL